MGHDYYYYFFNVSFGCCMYHPYDIKNPLTTIFLYNMFIDRLLVSE